MSRYPQLAREVVQAVQERKPAVVIEGLTNDISASFAGDGALKENVRRYAWEARCHAKYGNWDIARNYAEALVQVIDVLEA